MRSDGALSLELLEGCSLAESAEAAEADLTLALALALTLALSLALALVLALALALTLALVLALALAPALALALARPPRLSPSTTWRTCRSAFGRGTPTVARRAPLAT